MILLFGFVLVASLWFLMEVLVLGTKTLTLFETFVGIAFLALIAWGFTSALTLKVTVTREGIVVRKLRHQFTYSWNEVYAINVMPNFFWSYNLILGVPERKRGLFLLTSFLGNGHTVIKAILEAAQAANPEVKLVGWHHFGPPPYGIFPEAKPTAPSRSGAEAEVQDHKAPGSS
jgi:hypothetical protein